MSHVFELVQLLLAGASAIASDLVEDLFLHGSLGSHQTSSRAQKRPEALLSIDNVRVTLSLSNAPADLIVLKGSQTIDKRQSVEEGLSLFAVVDAL